jgi:hypothetical protein
VATCASSLVSDTHKGDKGDAELRILKAATKKGDDSLQAAVYIGSGVAVCG